MFTTVPDGRIHPSRCRSVTDTTGIARLAGADRPLFPDRCSPVVHLDRRPRHIASVASRAARHPKEDMARSTRIDVTFGGWYPARSPVWSRWPGRSRGSRALLRRLGHHAQRVGRHVPAGVLRGGDRRLQRRTPNVTVNYAGRWLGQGPPGLRRPGRPTSRARTRCSSREDVAGSRAARSSTSRPWRRRSRCRTTSPGVEALKLSAGHDRQDLPG